MQLSRIFTPASRLSRPGQVRLICLIGMDGSGKTTLASQLTVRMREMGYDVQYVHGILLSHILLKPLKLLARQFFMRGTNEISDYMHYRNTKIEVSHRHGWMSWLYSAVWFLDYYVEAIRRITWPVIKGRTMIADRYIYDLILNIALTTGRPVTALTGLIDLFFRLNPRPDFVFVVDAPEEVAFARKSDVHSIDYLRDRRTQYLALAERYQFPVLDGRSDLNALVDELVMRCVGGSNAPANARL